MRSLLICLALTIIYLVPSSSLALKETVAMSAEEHSRKWEPFLGHRAGLWNDKDWNDLYEKYKSFHKNNNIIITGTVVYIIHDNERDEKYPSIHKVHTIELEGIDSTNEYGFKCNVKLDVNAKWSEYIDGIPQEQLRWVEVGDIVSISYEGYDGFEGERFCVNHKDWDNQKHRINARLHEVIRTHALYTGSNETSNSWWKENGEDATPKLYRISESKYAASVDYDIQVANTIQRSLIKKIRKMYEDETVSIFYNDNPISSERFDKQFNQFNEEEIKDILIRMRDDSFRIKVCGRKFTDVVEYNEGNGFVIPIPPKIGEIGYVWHWRANDVARRFGFSWTSDDLNKEIIKFLDKYPLKYAKQQ